jgi:fumarate reductase flavoprotein subunit
MELGPRDRLSQAFIGELEKGRTIETPYGQVVHLDLRHLGEKIINTRLPFVRELCLKYEGIDPITELVPVRPVVHYMMGGVHTNAQGATPLPGLYAAGEAACVSINGANRLGSNSLPEILVFGAASGKAAAQAAADLKPPSRHIPAQALDEQHRLEDQFLRKSGGKERIATLRTEMLTSMESGAGIYRNRASLEKTVAKVRELQERFKDLAIDDHSRTFNTDLTAALELEFLLDVASTIAESALRRTESRGAHQRTDFPDRDDKKFLAHTLVRRNSDGSARIEYSPVVITRWPPGKRVYGSQQKTQETVVR